MHGTTFNTPISTTRSAGKSRSNHQRFATIGGVYLRQLQGIVFGLMATLLLLWTWLLLPAGQATHAYAAWIGIGAVSLAGVAFIEAELGRALIALAAAGLGFALAYWGMTSPTALAIASVVLAATSFLLAPRAYADTLHAAGWHYAILAATAPILI